MIVTAVTVLFAIAIVVSKVGSSHKDANASQTSTTDNSVRSSKNSLKSMEMDINKKSRSAN